MQNEQNVENIFKSLASEIKNIKSVYQLGAFITLIMAVIIILAIFKIDQEDTFNISILALIPIFVMTFFILKIMKLHNSIKTIKTDEKRQVIISNPKDKMNSCHIFLQEEQGEGCIECMVVNHFSHERHNEFGLLKKDATHSIFIMGLGITSVTESPQYLSSLLTKGINVRLLMIDPAVIRETFVENQDAYNLLIKYFHLDEYVNRAKYCDEVEISFNRVAEFIRNFKKTDNEIGKIELRAFDSFIPMSLTAINETNKNKNTSLITEFLLPFSNKRALLKMSYNEEGKMYTSFMESMESIWDYANSKAKNF